MRYGSVCSGVEAATLAWHHLGWKPVFFSEVEPFPCAVLQERLGASAPINPLAPEEATSEDDRKMRESWIKQNNLLKKEGIIPNEGDFTKIGNKYAGKIDLLVGGTPCQDLSVAGKRAGFEGERSSLAIDFVRLAYESKCKWIVWENVPGVFSSNGGRDFATFLSLLSGAEVEVPVNGWGTAGFVCNARPDRYGLSWRTLDGQFTRTSRFPFAVPQRRRRVFVVGYFGDWTRAAEVLLEPERLYWDTPTRFKARERITGIIEKSTGTADTDNVVNFASSSFGNYSETDFGGTLKSSGGDLAGGSENLSVFWNGNDFAETLKTNCNSDRMPDKGKLNCVIERNDIAATLTAAYADKMGIENQHVNQGCPNFIVGYNGAGDTSGDVTPTLQANLGKLLSNQTPIICKADGFMARAGAESDIVYQNECSPTVRATMEPCILLNDQGGSVMQVEKDGNAGTLRANSHGNEQIVCAGFLGTQGSKARSIGYSEDHAPTLRAGAEIDLVQILKIRSGCEGGGKGALIQDELSATLGCGNDQTLFCVHGSQDPICNNDHANAVNRNNGLENCVVSLNSKQFNAMEKELASTLLSTDYKEPQVVCYENHANDSRVTEMGECCQSLTSRAGTGGGNLPLVQECYALDSVGSNSMKSSNPNSGFHKEEIAKTLDTSAPYPEKNQGGNVIVDAVAIAENVIGRKVENGGNGVGAQEELAYTQNASGVMGVCTKGNGDAFESEVHTSLSASGGGQAGQGYPCVRNSMTVRRLLPIECERLMGFQDNWTQIPWRGKPVEECPDAPRYKACGNSMCVNVMQWIGEQIERVEKEMNEK
jgi:site-specific DNA-cytosine methylase